MPKRRGPQEEDFDGLLAWLHLDGDVAADMYETIRGDLISIFRWRGCADPEGMADETIIRVSRKVGEVAASYTGPPALYFYGVAKNLLHEYERRRDTSLLTQPEPFVLPADPEEEDARERAHKCFERCLRKLNARERGIAVRYYEGKGRAKINNRKKLADELGIDLNALRVRTGRTRSRLRKCIEDCLAAKSR